MPVLDGLRAATQIRKLEPASRIILFTMFASRQMEHYAQLFGVDEVVAKSDNGYKLLAAIRKPSLKQA
jgi:DNA-binding NarL/FixJ family response regulator